MGLKATIQSTVKTVFANTIPDLLTTITYSEVGTSTYNTTTGATAQTNVSHSIPVLFTSFSKKEVDGIEIKPFDKKVLIERQAVTFTPKVNDFLVDALGTWEVVQVRDEPSESIFLLQVRRP